MSTLGKRWSRLTPDVSDAIVTEYCAGSTAAELARVFRVSTNTVLRHVHWRRPDCVRRRGPRLKSLV